MTEAESLDLAATFVANSSTNFTIFISFSFAFLVAAFIAGSKLSRFQALAAAGMYTLFAASAAIASVGWLQAFSAITEREATLLVAVPLFSGQFWVTGMSILFLTGMSVSIYFLWSVRHPKAERPV
jgi:hypothetical protein